MVVSIPVQIWAPGIVVEPFRDALIQAHLKPELLADLTQPGGEQPLLIAYTEPVDLLGLEGSTALWPVDPYGPLLAALPAVEAGTQPWRLVNLACLCPARVVGWCIEPQGGARPPEVRCQFRLPDPLDALLARHWLIVQPQTLQAYLRLERHPLSAVLDQRPADETCLRRLEEASSPQALAGVRRRWKALTTHLAWADDPLRGLHQLQCDNQGLRERNLNLELDGIRRQARIAELEAREEELELTLKMAQEDLGQLSRRITLLEQLVVAGAEASRNVQVALAKVLTA